MSLQLYLGSAGSGKSHQMYHNIIEESIKIPTPIILLLFRSSLLCKPRRIWYPCIQTMGL